jgi:hypothetical protein
MRPGFVIAILLVTGFVPGQAVCAQAPPAQQNKPADTQKPKPPAGANPFPEDTTSVPVMSDGNAPAAGDVPAPRAAPATAPIADVDPVRSPDDPRPDANPGAGGFSSSAAGLDNVMPPPDTDLDTRHGKKGRGAAPAPDHQESAAEDERVGSYYLDSKAWKAALSRYQSALVLDPENPEVYWGLGEAQRHMGKMAEAKAAYEKLVEYDPDSKHGKEAKKILKSAEMATASAKQP